MEGGEEVDEGSLNLSQLEAQLAEAETGSLPPPLSSVTGPLGPRRDSVFPSLPQAGTAAVPLADVRPAAVVAFPFVRNVFTMAAVPWGMSRAEFLAAAVDTISVREGSPASLDRAERERVAAVAAEFVQNHARRIERDFYIKTPHRHFTIGTIVVSEDHVPTSRSRHAKFQWAITDGQIVELRNVRLPVGHLGNVDRPGRTDFGDACRGDLNDLAFFLAVLLDVFDVDASAPLAAIGDIVLLATSSS